MSDTGPVAPFTGSWTGTATSSGATNDASCVEGVNCDSFRLSLAPGVYTKQVRTKLQWSSSTNNYDLHVHKCPSPAATNSVCNATTPIATSAATSGTEESALFDPQVWGTGDYTVHALYLTATIADQYQGSATLEAPPTAIRVHRLHASRRADGGVRIDWRSSALPGLLGFDVFRVQSDRLVKVNDRLIRTPAAGMGGQTYFAIDRRTPSQPRLTYSLQAVRLDGTRTSVATVPVRPGP